MTWVIVAVVIVVLLVLGLVLLYNRLVRLRNRTENAWAQVDVQLRRRYDLVPNLVESVKGYAAHERETFEAVTGRADGRAQAARGRAAGAGRERADRGARAADRDRRGLPRAAGERELPASRRGSSTSSSRSPCRARSTTTPSSPNERDPDGAREPGRWDLRVRAPPYFEIDDPAREPVQVQF